MFLRILEYLFSKLHFQNFIPFSYPAIFCFLIIIVSRIKYSRKKENIRIFHRKKEKEKNLSINQKAPRPNKSEKNEYSGFKRKPNYF